MFVTVDNGHITTHEEARMDPILTLAAKLLLAGDMTAGTLNGAKIVLFSNDLTINQNTVIGDLTVVTVAGMVAFAVTWDAPWLNAAGEVVVSAPSHVFAATAVPGAPLNAFGWAITNGAGTELYAAVKFDAAVGVSKIGDGVSVQPLLTPFN
jgi:hypothetical protein